MNRKRTSFLAASLLLAGQLAGGALAARASDFDLGYTGLDAQGAGSSSDLGPGNFGFKHFSFTLDARVGYDDNDNATSDATFPVVTASGRTVQRTLPKTDSVFFNFDLGASYTAATSRSALSVAADVGTSYFIDRPGRNYDVNGGLSGHFTYKLAPRVFMEFNTYNAYISQGDYGASNLTNFNGASLGGVRAPGASENVNADYFYTTDSLALTVQVAPRISLVSGYSITAFAYDTSFYATDDDRVEQTLSEEFRFLLLPNLTLAADYRIEYIDYFSINSDSLSNFLLGGVDYIFNPRLRGSLRAGAEFRVYTNSPGNGTYPYAEASLSYNLSRRSDVEFIARYGIEEGGLTSDVSNAETLRLGISYNQQLTARISGYLSFYFTHSYYENPQGNIPNFNEDTFDVAVGGRYAINRNLSLEAGYTHTTVDSQEPERAYQRDRVFGGVRLSF